MKHVATAHRSVDARRDAGDDEGGRHSQGARRRSHAGDAVVEDVPVPELGPNEVLVLVMAAGVNFNGVWAAAGKPVSVFRMHKEPFHIAGSDASGIVWKVGKEVRRWKVGDEVVIHCNQSCGQCPECNGLDPMACSEQKIWGYETSWGSFAQFTKVQAQQLVPKPKQLSWEDAASYGLTYFTAYRMLVGRAQVKPGDNVLVWGAAGGLGIFALQICKILGANPDRRRLVAGQVRHGASRSAPTGVINRKDFAFAWHANETPEQTKKRMDETKRLGAEIRKLTGGKDPDVIFEHVGQETFPASVFLCKRFGKIVICGATSRLQPRVRRALLVDAAEGDPRLALRQRLSGGARQRARHQRQDQAGARSGVRLRRHAAGAPAHEREQAQGQARHPHPGAESVSAFLLTPRACAGAPDLLLVDNSCRSASPVRSRSHTNDVGALVAAVAGIAVAIRARMTRALFASLLVSSFIGCNGSDLVGRRRSSSRSRHGAAE